MSEEEVGRMRSSEGILFTQDADESGCVETSRITINTHTSLLNMADEDEEDEEEEELLHNNTRVVVINDERPPTPPSHPLCRPCFKTNNAITPKHSMLDRVTEKFMESFCFTQSREHDKSDVPDLQLSPSISPSSSAEEDNLSEQVQSDVFDILACVTQPSTPELQYLWNGCFCYSLVTHQQQDARPQRPQHRTFRQRARKVRRLREARGDIIHRASPISVLQTRSFDINVLRQQSVLNPEASPSKIELGYDSDPEDVCFTASFVFNDTPVIMENGMSTEQSLHNNMDVSAIVQESFNMTWDLKLHPSDGGHPVVIRAWLEKGTILHHDPYMLEPSLMWKKPNESRPRRLRLLNICRIVALQVRSHQYPYARPRRCWTLRTAETAELLVLEAPSDDLAQSVMARWKHCIARFAMLAVMEDVRAIQREFFHKAPTTSMLVPDYDDLEDEDC
ncbi:hypothetical protein FisN_19Lh069 [Fistulifera solaris]|uniref:Uncharacterized protein n=1 Tax=Fistulifera solaris TaxID=1519565 RepID=A0A1Z5JRA2_FISSO|nr:hypothetical protein FisN_19Lh069 [Fistulifera solaris]|eukprot:GAX16489.1 hypothetical protein FisN_19Lh069 [Fistulifera solaris]